MMMVSVFFLFNAVCLVSFVRLFVSDDTVGLCVSVWARRKQEANGISLLICWPAEMVMQLDLCVFVREGEKATVLRSLNR